MNPVDLCFASIPEIAHLVTRGDIPAEQVIEIFLARIAAVDRVLNCFIRVMADEALAQARDIDVRILEGETPGPLAGVPIAIKDIVDIAGLPTTAGAHPRFHTRPRADAPLVRSLREAGAIVIGKTNLHEFAYGVTNLNPHYGPTRNPWDPTRIPGGSSGGSAASVAAGLCAGAVGTDTGGSIRIPAALCGIVGIKPTYSRVPREGVIPLAWTLDHVGPLTRTVRDAALLLRMMAEAGTADPSSSARPVPPFDDLLDAGISGFRIGIPRGYFWERLDEEVRILAEDAADRLGHLGAVIRDVKIPHASEAGRAVAIIIAVEATAFHEQRLRAHADAYGEDLRTRLQRGLFVTGTDYVQAQRARRFLTREFLMSLSEVDVLVTPTTPLTATSIEEDHQVAANVSISMSLQLTRFTNPFNLTGLPALSVPCGFTALGLPVGLQIVGKPFDEASVLRVGHAYEQATDWHRRRPPL